MTVKIRKTTMPYKGGPGAAGIRFDPTAERLKIHPGDTELVVPAAEEQAAIADPAGGATVDAEARAAIVDILAALEAFGLIAS